MKETHLNIEKKAVRPKKHISEKGIRTSSMLSPKCRKIIDELCRSKECSISKAIEFYVNQYDLKERIKNESNN